jgi:tetratricopeptide (TPR) repeat protein
MPSRAIVVSALIALVFPLGIAAATVDPAAEVDAARAQALLDQSDPGPQQLAEAEAAIKASMEKGVNAHALVEGARLTMIRERESRSSLQSAGRSLRLATFTDPAYDRAFVVQAYVAMKLGDMPLAQRALHRAEELHSKDPWFKLNYAMYYERTGDMLHALKMREEIAESETRNPKALESALSELQQYYVATGDRAEMDRIQARMVSLWPGEAYVRGDYAREVATQFADFDAGERAAREALKLMDYPHARQTLSLALYGRWASAKRDRKDMSIVRSLLDAAQAYDPHAALVPTCSLQSPRLFFLRDALIALDARYDPTLHNC